MQKGTFYLWMSYGYKLVDGYIDTINGEKVGFHKGKSGYWQATHIPTGAYIVGGDKTRKGIVEALPYWLESFPKPTDEQYINAVNDMNNFLKTVAG